MNRLVFAAILLIGRLVPFSTEQSAELSVEVRINIEDWPLKNSVEAHEVRADSYLAKNNIKAPNTVTLAGPKVDHVEDSGRMTYQLKKAPIALCILPISPT